MDKNMDASIKNISKGLVIVGSLLLVTACSSGGGYQELPSAKAQPSLTTDIDNYNYLIGPQDNLEIFVWGNPEISGVFQVRPDGKLSTSLVDDLDASGKTPTELAREIESYLSEYVRDPIVTVIVQGFVGPFSEQVRVIGEAAQPQAISYREHMTLLDVMISVGGLTEFANGNGANLIRVVNGKQVKYSIRLDDLVKEGEISANVDILPGDIVIIPEAWF
jgi:polysaccharide export outer membrane protein